MRLSHHFFPVFFTALALLLGVGISSPAHAVDYDDGFSNAPLGVASQAGVLDGYKLRPGWKVAGVDYAVGVASDATLKDPATCTCLPDGATLDETSHVIHVTGANVVLDGFNFGLHGGTTLDITGSHASLLHSYFFKGGVVAEAGACSAATPLMAAARRMS